MTSSRSVHTDTLKPALDILQFFLQNNLDSAGQWINDNPEIVWTIDRQVHCSQPNSPQLTIQISSPFMRVFGGPSNLSGTRRLEIGYEYLLAVNTGMLEAMSIIQTGIQQIGQQLAQEKMKLTVQHLPDEILMHIFEFVFDDEDRFTAIQLQETFPRVCKRWCTLVYAIPRFWNKLYSFQSPRYIDTCLERSKRTGLELYLENTKLDAETGKDMFTEAARFCAQLLPHSQRWESFSLVADASRSTALTLFNSIRVHSGSLQLPNLHSMHITWTSMDVTSDEDLLNNDDLHFYSSWGMPKLSKLVVDNFIPRLCIGHTLTSCELYFASLRRTNVLLLLDFLRSLIRVQELKLSFRYIDGIPWPDLDVPASLPSLQKLSLVFKERSPEFASELVPSLDIPNVTDIDITATLEHWSELHELLSCFEEEEAYDSVKRFSIRVERSSTVFDQHINMVFDIFPNLEHLDIGAHDAISDLHSSFNCPSLKSLRFIQCDAFNGNIAKAIIDQVEHDGRLEEFEKLEVICCPTFNSQRYFLVNKLPKEKVDWKRIL